MSTLQLAASTGREVFDPSELILRLKEIRTAYLERVHGADQGELEESKYILVELVSEGATCDAITFYVDEKPIRVTFIPVALGDLIITIMLPDQLIAEVKIIIPYQKIATGKELGPQAEALLEKINAFLSLK